jgi:hypothetical protein
MCAAWTIDACMAHKISEADNLAGGRNDNYSSTIFCVIKFIGLEVENE